jgi:hypothetical protein
MHDVLRVGIWCAITSISLLLATVLCLELQQLTPLGILHMASFMTLCEAYTGIEHHFDLWSYFFRARLQKGLDSKMAALGSVDLYVHSRFGIDPYFHLPMSDPSVVWWNVWFFLSNDTDVPLLVVTGTRSTPQPKWGYGVARAHICRLQLMRDVIQRQV